METLNTPVSLHAAWAGKGIRWRPGMWACCRDDETPIITVWFRDLATDATEVKFDDAGNPARLAIPDDSWTEAGNCSAAQKSSLQKYNEVCLDAKDAKVPAQVIFLIGQRRPDGGTSKVRDCVIRRDAYAVLIERIGADGSMDGTFISKQAYDHFRRTRGQREPARHIGAPDQHPDRAYRTDDAP